MFRTWMLCVLFKITPSEQLNKQFIPSTNIKTSSRYQGTKNAQYQLKTKICSLEKQPGPIDLSQTSSIVGIQGRYIKQLQQLLLFPLQALTLRSSPFLFLFIPTTTHQKHSSTLPKSAIDQTP
jgi:hypothetical protein